MIHYKQGLSSIFWGLLIVFLDFDINGVSLLPDFVGFILVLSGIREISKQDKGMNSLVPWTYGLIVLSAIAWFSSFIRVHAEPALKQHAGILTIELPIIDLFFITDGIEQVITLVFVILLMNYYIQLVKHSSEEQWGLTFIRRRNFYVVVNGLLLFSMPFVVIFPGWLPIVFIFLLLLSFIAFIRVLMTAYRMKKIAETETFVELEGMEQIKPFYVTRKKLTITALVVIILSWAGSILWLEQWRLEEPLLLPAFIATTGDDYASVYYVHNGKPDDLEPQFIFYKEFEQESMIFFEGYFAIGQLRFRTGDHEGVKDLLNSEFRLSNGKRLKNNGQLYYLELRELNTDPSKYMELQSGSGDASGYSLTFKVRKSFQMIEELAVPFPNEVHDYFTFAWKGSSEYEEGELVTFTIQPKEMESNQQLATFQSPVRIVVDGGEGEEIIDVGWVEYYPRFNMSSLQDYVRQFK
ncbi:hypothetical protein [Alkalihalobacterium chitinilyticum]|uniref:DUF975 family protein n=1 Tax=Alkalihalobacterium chitinilyticum TaxID=2980103 RepID=A0ABT5VG26_9BACI|nr:hypothetical protein [Alkalihalobacterium chitinilyticum]MDE5414410.1 hypothetical protein [Alkalihalobacterium chitinilyticum]